MGLPFLEVLSLLEMFHQNDPKSHVPFIYFPTGNFRTFLLMENSDLIEKYRKLLMLKCTDGLVVFMVAVVSKRHKFEQVRVMEPVCSCYCDIIKYDVIFGVWPLLWHFFMTQ